MLTHVLTDRSTLSPFFLANQPVLSSKTTRNIPAEAFQVLGKCGVWAFLFSDTERPEELFGGVHNLYSHDSHGKIRDMHQRQHRQTWTVTRHHFRGPLDNVWTTGRHYAIDKAQKNGEVELRFLFRT